MNPIPKSIALFFCLSIQTHDSNPRVLFNEDGVCVEELLVLHNSRLNLINFPVPLITRHKTSSINQ